MLVVRALATAIFFSLLFVIYSGRLEAGCDQGLSWQLSSLIKLSLIGAQDFLRYAQSALPDVLLVDYKFLPDSLFSTEPQDPLACPLPYASGVRLHDFQVRIIKAKKYFFHCRFSPILVVLKNGNYQTLRDKI